MKDRDQDLLWETYNKVNENLPIGTFGPGGHNDPQQGSGTSDEVTYDDISGKIREINSIVNTMNTWVEEVLSGFSDDPQSVNYPDYDEMYSDLEEIGRHLQKFGLQHDIENAPSIQQGREMDNEKDTASVYPDDPRGPVR